MTRPFLLLLLLAALSACTCETDTVFLGPEEQPRPFLVTSASYPIPLSPPNDRYDYVGIQIQFNQPVDTTTLQLDRTVRIGGDGIVTVDAAIGAILPLNSSTILIVTQRRARIFTAPPPWQYYIQCQSRSCSLLLELISDPKQNFGIQAIQTRQYLDGNSDGTDGGNYSKTFNFQ